MRTQDEIMRRFETRRENDPLGFEVIKYIDYMDFAHARLFLKDDMTEQEWKEEASSLDIPVERMHGYMEFAWDKANNCRGISANRSVMHCIAWLWLAEEDELLARVENEFESNYHYYGKPILEMICNHFGWNWKQWDDGIRSNG